MYSCMTVLPPRLQLTCVSLTSSSSTFCAIVTRRAHRHLDWPTVKLRRDKSNTVTILIGAGLRVGGAWAPVSPRLRKTPFWSDSGSLTEKSRSRFLKGNCPDLTHRSEPRIVVLFWSDRWDLWTSRVLLNFTLRHGALPILWRGIQITVRTLGTSQNRFLPHGDIYHFHQSSASKVHRRFAHRVSRRCLNDVRLYLWTVLDLYVRRTVYLAVAG